MERINAPFSWKQVYSINGYQFSRRFHPFTCGSGNRTNAAHSDMFKRVGIDYGLLIARPSGLFCPTCGYTQEWVHASMANWARTETITRSARGLYAALLFTMAAKSGVPDFSFIDALENAENGGITGRGKFSDIASLAADELSYWGD